MNAAHKSENSMQASWTPPDGDIVWVLSVGERRLFHIADGYSLVAWP
ncbi:hypothetical protein [Paenarthrobacter nitroguajacolicus]